MWASTVGANAIALLREVWLSAARGGCKCPTPSVSSPRFASLRSARSAPGRQGAETTTALWLLQAEREANSLVEFGTGEGRPVRHGVEERARGGDGAKVGDDPIALPREAVAVAAAPEERRGRWRRRARRGPEAEVSEDPEWSNTGKLAASLAAPWKGSRTALGGARPDPSFALKPRWPLCASGRAPRAVGDQSCRCQGRRVRTRCTAVRWSC